MENEEEKKIEETENRERIFVNVRRQETQDEEGIPEKLAENAWKMPRRWHIY